MINSRIWLGPLLLAGLATSAAAGANDTSAGRATVQVPALEVKARISSMEQVNVTAEKPIDEQAPAPSESVAQLLLELAELESSAETETGGGKSGH